jgi:hypothetical protein
MHFARFRRQIPELPTDIESNITRILEQFGNS